MVFIARPRNTKVTSASTFGEALVVTSITLNKLKIKKKTPIIFPWFFYSINGCDYTMVNENINLLK
jgi:hypothetical protein